MTMDPDKNGKPTYKDYGELWNYNLQKIENIHNEIEKSIHELEYKYVDFETAYTDITRQLNILSSIYAGYNTVHGRETVLRLKAVLESYRKRYTRESLDFNLVYGLLLKIADVRNAGFEDFPRLHHGEIDAAVTEGEAPEGDYSQRAHRWVTFQRNRSWFIAPFSTIDIMKHALFPVISVEEPDCLTLSVNNREVKVRDIFLRSAEHPESPPCVILLDRGTRNYAADRIGRRIYAERDIITPMLRPFRTVRSHSLSPGRLRLFGENHILLR